MTIAVLNAMMKPKLESRLPNWVEPRWFASSEELYALAPLAEIGWFDSFAEGVAEQAVRLATALKWLNTVGSGVEYLPLALLDERGVVLTNGAGINAVTIGEYAVMGMLTVAKSYHDVIRAADRGEWLEEAPGKMELLGSKALLLGVGEIGSNIAARLDPFGVEVTKARRHPRPGELGPRDWRARLGEFDWVIISVPSTPETRHLMGASELAAMKTTACVMNFARGDLIDQEALIDALTQGRIGAAFLDVTDPEPLPPGHPLWKIDNCHISMHLSGRSQTLIFTRAAERFLDNLGRWYRGEPLAWQVDLALGY
ncbi:MAG: D-2-hydroxyacid dehydrogenase [Novosphingobium sp.]